MTSRSAFSVCEPVRFHPLREYSCTLAPQIGCGDALVDEARSIAKSGSRRLEAIALPGDRETKNLYERAAITAKAITVAVDLSDPSS